MLLGGDNSIGSLPMLNPIRDNAQPIHIACARAASAMQTARNHEEATVLRGIGIMSHNLPIVSGCGERRQSRISPAVPNDEFAMAGFEGVQIRVSGVEKRSSQARVLLEVGEIVS